MAVTNKTIEQLSIDTIRTLSIDAVEKANSGHPGMPMGSAPMAYELWSQFMKINPDNPKWINRDRFVLSAGHGSMLLYSLLHLCGYDLSLDELKNFRQWQSKTPGHPEYGHTPGVDATTGPLGQGFGMAVGMAMAEAHMAAVYNKTNFPVIDHYTYVICGDGDLMEGLSNEAASLSAHLKLGKLIMLYDSNDISLDGELSLSFSENVQTRFQGYGWQVLRVDDGNDLAAIHKAIVAAQADPRPTLIEVKTVIGYGSPNKGGKGGHIGPHGSPLGASEAVLTKEFYGWPHEPFFIPEEVKAHFAEIKQRGIHSEQSWSKMLTEYGQAYPELAGQFSQAVKGDKPEGWDAGLPSYSPSDKAISTRTASYNALNGLASHYPMLIGGSADLEISTLTHLNGIESFTPEDYSGRNVYFGVREFGMGAAINGMMLHGGVRPFGATFFVFSDYLRPSIRLASIMKLPVIYVFTHDSIGVGEDGPTHEPVEQLAALRVMINLTVLRPCDGNETSAAYRYALDQQEGPCALILSRQNLAVLEGTKELAHANIGRGAYVLSDAKDGKPQVQLLATGSEVSLAVEAQKQLATEGIQARVVSMPSWELFNKQDQAYRDSVILPHVKARLAIEMAHPMGWDRYVGEQGAILGISQYGASAPGPTVIKEYGFNVENVVAMVKNLL